MPVACDRAEPAPGVDSEDCVEPGDPIAVSEFESVAVDCPWVGGGGGWLEEGGEERLLVPASECGSEPEDRIERIDTKAGAFEALEPTGNMESFPLLGLSMCTGGDVDADGIAEVTATWTDEDFTGTVILDPWSDNPALEPATQLLFDGWTHSHLSCAYADDRLLVGSPIYPGGGRIFGYESLAPGVYSEADAEYLLFSQRGDVGVGAVLERVGDLDGDGLTETAILGYSRTWLLGGTDLADGVLLDDVRSLEEVVDSSSGSLAGGADFDGDGLHDWAAVTTVPYEDSIVAVRSGVDVLAEVRMPYNRELDFGSSVAFFQGSSGARLIVSRHELDSSTLFPTRGELLSYEGPWCGVLDADEGEVVSLGIEPMTLGTLIPGPEGLALAMVVAEASGQRHLAAVTWDE